MRRPLLGHVAGALSLSAVLGWRSHEATTAALVSLGVPDPGAAVAAIGVLVVTLGTLLLLGTLALGAVVLHLGSRLAGSDRAFPVSASTYLVATAPLWVRNLLLAGALLLGLDPARLGSLAFGDPFLLLAGYLAVVGLREVHRLSLGRALVVGAVTVLGGVVAGLLTSLAS
ncbi:MAG: YIP1 family protein [Actinomycetota bacterium]|nr:YIP1 family protein [Actinomycetota bacterium]